MNSHHVSTKKTPLSIKDMTITALMTAVTCILGPLAIPMPFSPVPISFTNLALYLMVYVLNRRCSFLSYTLYFLLGAAGLPVFSGFSGGLGRIVGPTGGYLIGFFFQILISGFIVERWNKKRIPEIIGLVLGTITSYIFGTLWLAKQLEISFTAGLSIGVLPYLPGDGAKIALAAIIAPKLRRAIEKNA